jgi:hypothetical protein
MVSGVDVDALVAVVCSCHFVSDLAEGGPGSAATYLPGRRVTGIAVDDTRVRIQVRSCWGAPAHVVVEEIRAAARSLVGDRIIDVIIADVEDPPGGWPPSHEDASPPQTPPLSASPTPTPRPPEAGAPPAGPPPAR